MSKTKLVVDGQVFQTTARDRGMGRYAVCLLQALIATKTYDVTFIVSSELPFQEDDRKLLSRIFQGADFHTLDLHTTKRHKIEEACKHNEAVLANYMETHAAPDSIFFIPSLFQEPVAAVFPKGSTGMKALLFHDLIPYLYHNRYAPVMMWENYLKRFRYLFEADLIFANSQATADDLNMYLGVPRHKLCRIDGAAIHTDSASERPAHIDTSRPFILLNTSDDPRKNNLRSILAFEEFKRSSDKEYSLILTSQIHKREREHLQRFSHNLQFTGNIPERELNWLYSHCEAVLFVPENEGLGLPALEAVDAGKKVVCSSIDVLREISTDAFFYCNYENSYAIAQALAQAVDPAVKVNKAAYKTILSHYTWPRTAERMLQGLQAWTPPKQIKKPKLAILMPTPNGLTGVGLTGAILHPTLAEQFDIDYYLEYGLSNESVRPNYLQYVAPCYPATSFSAKRYATYDAVFYHIGNGDYHLESIMAALNLPGYLIVHDTTVAEAYRVLHETGMMSEERAALEARLDTLIKTTKSSDYTSLANRQLGILVHSDYAYEAMNEVLDTAVSVLKANLPIAVPQADNLHDTQDNIVIGLAGAISDVKGLDVIKNIAEDPEFDGCDIRLFGISHASPQRLAELSAYDNVSIATNVSDFDFQTNVSKLDIFVNYRLAYKGETSNTTLEAMRQGVVAIVRKVGWYDELPDDVVVKVKGPEAVIPLLRDLVHDAKRRQALGKRAKAYVSQHFSTEQYAVAMKELLAQDLTKNPNAALTATLKSGRIKSPNALRSWLHKKGLA